MAFKIVIEGVVEFILERVDLIESEMEGGGIIDEGEVITGRLITLPFPTRNTASAVLIDDFYGLPLLVLPDHVLKEGS
jgi:hypothetical protein